MNCTLVPVSNDDILLNKMWIFGIDTPNREGVVNFNGQDYYCVAYYRSHFTEASLAALDSEEAISAETKKYIKKQYMKICSFAFLFGISKDCIRDKYNRLIPVDLSSKNQHTILSNNNGMYSPSLVAEVVNSIYESLNVMMEDNIITRDEMWELIDKYQDQLDFDDLIIAEPETSTCCCCGDICNPCSQACGQCARSGRLLYFGLNFIDQEGNEITSTSESKY